LIQNKADREDESRLVQRMAEPMLQQLFENIPVPASKPVIVLPHHHGAGVPLRMVEWFAPACREVAAQVVSGAASRREAVGPLLDEEWLNQHSTLMVGDAPPLPKKDIKSFQRTRCFVAGVCLCKRRGLMLALFLAKFDICFKQFFPKGASLRKLLDEGYVVLLLRPGPTPMQPEPEPEGSLAAEAPALPQSRWFHVAMMYYKPYRQTLLELGAASAASDEPPAAPAPRVELEVPTPSNGASTLFGASSHALRLSLCDVVNVCACL